MGDGLPVAQKVLMGWRHWNYNIYGGGYVRKGVRRNKDVGATDG